MEQYLEDLKRAELAEKGKKTEDKVRKVLSELASHKSFDFQRLPDARACRGRLEKQISDYLFFTPKGHGALEVKELKKGTRLPRRNLDQLPKLYRRSLAGGRVVVLVRHLEEQVWRVPPFRDLWSDKSPSWDLKLYPFFETAAAALWHAFEEQHIVDEIEFGGRSSGKTT